MKGWLLAACLLFGWLLVLPVQAQAPRPDPRFGIVETYANFEAAAMLGVGYTRIILRWDVIQPNGPQDWEPANVPDPFVATDLAAGREVVAIIIGTPAWARDPDHPGNDPEIATAKDVPKMEAWAAFTRRLAEHYRGRITHWIIWNEPDVWDPAHPGSTWNGTVEDFARLQKTAYLSIKAVDPALQVHLTGLTYFWDWEYNREQYLAHLLQAIAADPEASAHNYYFDAVVYHLYYKPQLILNVLRDVRAILAAHGLQDKPIWINETNAPPSSDPQEPPHWSPRFRVSLAEQSAFLWQIIPIAFANGVERIEVYKLYNSPEHPEDNQPFGLLRGDGSPRPAFETYRTAITYLAGFQQVVLQQQGDIFVATFDRGQQTTTILWTIAPEPARYSLPAIAPEALLVDELGQTQPLTATGGIYSVELPGATCSHGECFIGGMPRMIVEAGPAAARGSLLPPSPTPTLTPRPTAPSTPTPPPTPAPPPTATPTSRPTLPPPPTVAPSPTFSPTPPPEPSPQPVWPCWPGLLWGGLAVVVAVRFGGPGIHCD